MTFLSKVTGKYENRSPYQGVVKHDWVPTGRIDFATHLNGNAEDADQPNDFKLLVEERRIVESIAGNENLEIQWRLATLKEAKAVVTHYHKYLSEHSLIKSVVEETLSLPAPKKTRIIRRSFWLLIINWPMSALGHKRTFRTSIALSAFTSRSDIRKCERHVR